MTEPVDPPRLFDESPDGDGGMREALTAARADMPSDARLAAILGGLPCGPVGGGGDGGGPGVGPSTVAASAAKTGATAKVALAAGLALVTAAVGYGVLSGPRTVVSSSPTSVASQEATPTSTATPTAEQAPSTDVTAAPTNAAPSATQASMHPVAPQPSAAASAAPRPEIEILREAQAAAGSSPARALALADEHERSYPNGSLGQEREMIRIQALVALGRRDEARARAASFKAAHPGSAYAQRIDDVVGP